MLQQGQQQQQQNAAALSGYVVKIIAWIRSLIQS
jgi:hypothetical protein